MTTNAPPNPDSIPEHADQSRPSAPTKASLSYWLRLIWRYPLARRHIPWTEACKASFGFSAFFSILIGFAVAKNTLGLPEFHRPSEILFAWIDLVFSSANSQPLSTLAGATCAYLLVFAAVLRLPSAADTQQFLAVNRNEEPNLYMGFLFNASQAVALSFDQRFKFIDAIDAKATRPGATLPTQLFWRAASAFGLAVESLFCFFWVLTALFAPALIFASLIFCIVSPRRSFEAQSILDLLLFSLGPAILLCRMGHYDDFPAYPLRQANAWREAFKSLAPAIRATPFSIASAARALSWIRTWIAGRIERAQASIVEAAADNETLARAERSELESAASLPDPLNQTKSRMRL